MDLSDLNQRFEQVKQKKSNVDQTLARLEGKLEAAQQSLREVEEDCRKRGVDPDQIDAVLDKLGNHYKTQVENLERELAEANQQLSEIKGQ